MLEWKEDLCDEEWDNIVSLMNGHPLQSAVWGNVKASIDRITDVRWIAFKNNMPVFLVRFEIRSLFKKIKIAWVPRGPIIFDKNYELLARREFLSRLKKRGFFSRCETPWIKAEKECRSNFFTIWVDLQLGKEQLWKNLNKQFRYDVRRSKKLGVSINISKSPEDLLRFYRLCKELSLSKDFHFSTTYEFMEKLFRENSKIMETVLFIANFEGNFCGGAYIIRCGKCVHYMWGVVDRKFSYLSIGQAIQWEVVEWALSKHCIRYDLEGITSKKNSGVDNFKKKIGGELVSNPGLQIYPFNIFAVFGSIFLKAYLFYLPRLNVFKNFLLNRNRFDIFSSKYRK